MNVLKMENNEPKSTDRVIKLKSPQTDSNEINMEPTICVEGANGNLKIITKEDINRMYDLFYVSGGEEAVASAAHACHNLEESDLEQVRDNVVDFYSNFLHIRNEFFKLMS